MVRSALKIEREAPRHDQDKGLGEQERERVPASGREAQKFKGNRDGDKRNRKLTMQWFE